MDSKQISIMVHMRSHQGRYEVPEGLTEDTADAICAIVNLGLARFDPETRIMTLTASGNDWLPKTHYEQTGNQCRKIDLFYQTSATARWQYLYSTTWHKRCRDAQVYAQLKHPHIYAIKANFAKGA